MINRWRAKIDWGGIYNVRNPPEKGEEKRKEKTVAICIILKTFVT